MLVSDTHKFVLFHFPKTAGTSMTEVLAPYLTPKLDIPKVKFMGWQPHHHYDLLQHQAVIKCMERGEQEVDVPKIPSGYFSASFIRNPYDLVVSAWWPPTISFEKFVIKEIATKKNVVARVGPQFDYLSDDRGNILVNFIGRYEQLEIDWQKFCYLVRLPDLKLPKINTSANLEQETGRTIFNKGDYRQHYNRTTYQIVNKMYKRDFNFFKYSEEL
jgi:hypothetical protein